MTIRELREYAVLIVIVGVIATALWWIPALLNPPPSLDPDCHPPRHENGVCRP